ncbi:MAG TPA: pyridoxal phosphate-dependent aminotransferase [Chloroflexota bacterium]|nr:pyridoxal phosphate-dependent aminotransferase [Chloroflexota bacterium]
MSALPPPARRAGALGRDSAFDLLVSVNRLRAAGRDVISFGIGEPDVETPPTIVDAAKRALDDRRTRYAPSDGLPELREAIAAHVSATRGIPVQPGQVVVAPGAKPFILYTIATLVDAGEDVVYPNPGFPTYESVIRWMGARAVPMPLVEANEFRIDRDALEGIISDRTKLIILNSPNNPTGGVLAQEDLERIADLAQRHNCWVLSDEIYSQLVLEGTAPSIASLPGMAERTIIMDGFSKSYAMTGWRLGFSVMNPALAELMTRVETNIESCTCTFTQIAGVEALLGPQDHISAYIGELRERADVVVALLNDIEGVRCVRPRGAFYAFPNVTGACERLGLWRAEALADRLLHEAGVAVLPRSCFGNRNPRETGEFVRLSFATSLELIHEGIGRMKTYIESGGKAL